MSVVDFESQLDRQMAWRFQELADILNIIHDKNTANFYVRGALLLVYAHWEGGVTVMACSYWEYLRSLNIPFESYAIEILISHIDSRIMQNTSLSSYDKSKEVYHFFANDLSKDAEFKKSHEIISGKSNLKSKLFKQICDTIGVYYLPFFQMSEKFIDSNLLAARNAVAHGEQRDVTARDIEECCNKVIDLLNAFKEEILNNVKNKSYIKRGIEAV